MKVNYVLMYGTPYLKYREFETFDDISKFLINKSIVNYTIFEKMQDNKEVEMIYLNNDIKVLKQRIDKAIEYINKYAWQEDIIGGIYTTTGKPAIDRYMKLEWDNCNELLDILKEVE